MLNERRLLLSKEVGTESEGGEIHYGRGFTLSSSVVEGSVIEKVVSTLCRRQMYQLLNSGIDLQKERLVPTPKTAPVPRLQPIPFTKSST